MNRMFAVTALAMLVATCPALAEEQWCKVEAGAKTLTQDEVKQQLTQKGYTIKGMGTEHGCIEGKGTDKDGKRVEVYVHPVTGEIIKVKG